MQVPLQPEQLNDMNLRFAQTVALLGADLTVEMASGLIDFGEDYFNNPPADPPPDP